MARRVSVLAAALVGIVSTLVVPAAAREARPDCDPHPPILIEEEEGPRGFVLARHPTTGEPIYRPGSGVVAGNGTANDPYVIGGWCIDVPPVEAPGLPFQDGIRIVGTDAHLVIRDTRVGSAPGTGIALVGAENVVVEDNQILQSRVGIGAWGRGGHVIRGNGVQGGTWGIAGDGAERLTVVDNRVAGTALVGIGVWRRPGHLIDGNVVEDGIWGIGVADGGDDTMVADNTLENRVDVRIEASSNVTLRGNGMERGLQLVRIDPATLDIDASNRVSGHPVVFQVGGDELMVEGSPGQVLVYDVAKVTVSGIEITRAVDGVIIVGGEDVVVENSTFGPDMGDAIRVTDAANVTINDNRIAGTTEDCVGFNVVSGSGIGISRARTSALVADNLVEGKARGMALDLLEGTDVVVRGNHVSLNSDGIRVYRSDAVLHDNTVVGNCITGIYLEFPYDVTIRDNLLVDNSDGVSIETADWSSAPVLRGNNIDDHDRFGVTASDWSTAGVIVDAVGNWWGCPAGPDHDDCDDVLGDVDFAPWLAEPNPDAGA